MIIFYCQLSPRRLAQNRTSSQKKKGNKKRQTPVNKTCTETTFYFFVYRIKTFNIFKTSMCFMAVTILSGNIYNQSMALRSSANSPRIALCVLVLSTQQNNLFSLATTVFLYCILCIFQRDSDESCLSSPCEFVTLI